MAGKGKARRRMLREILYLQEETTPEKPINIEALQEYLDDLTAIRAIIYDDLREMEQMNFGIRHERNGHYYYDRQSFSQGELALMIDLVCCAGYPDAKNAENLILRNKPDNPECIRNTDLIHEAIRESHQIRFRYGHTNIEGKTVADKEYKLSPYQLVWNSSHLYVIGGYEQGDHLQLRNFRVDKIMSLSVLPQKLRKLPKENPFYSAKLHGFDAERYLKTTFDMFNAADEKVVRVTFSVVKYLVGSMIDLFGENIRLKELDAEHMQFTAEVQVTNMFFGWLAKFTYDQLHILSPAELSKEYCEHLKEILAQYQ